METILLREPEIFPTKDVLRSVLGDCVSVLNELTETVTKPEFALSVEWNYYNDGKAWLCKVVYKKKTVFWLSVWDGYFKVTFYFNRNNYSGVFDLDIPEKVKADFSGNIGSGKFIPLVIKVTGRDQIEEIVKLVEFKKKLK
jgi:hypothetical protein